MTTIGNISLYTENINMMNSIPTVTVNNDRSFVAKTEPFTCRQARANLAQTFRVKSFPQFFESKSDNK